MPMLYFPGRPSTAIASRTKWTPAVGRPSTLDLRESGTLPKRVRQDALRPAKFDITKLVFFERRSDGLPVLPAAGSPRRHRKRGVDIARCAIALCLPTPERKAIETLEPKAERTSTLGGLQRIAKEA